MPGFDFCSGETQAVQELVMFFRCFLVSTARMDRTNITMDTIPTLDELLAKLLSVEGSDLHLKVGSPPAYRIDGVLQLAELPKLSADDTSNFAEQVLTDRAREEFAVDHETDFAYGKASLGRFRVNVYRQRGSVNLVVRGVNPTSQSFEDLGMPKVLTQLCAHQRGLIVVCGAAGSGKTTALAAMIDHINSTRRVNIITLEDPIEVLFPDKMSIVSQREIGLDTASMEEGLRRVVRQDPDVIMASEMRNLESVRGVLRAAETGHLVLAAMHTVDAVEAVKRIVEAFPVHERKQARLILAAVLRGVVAQRLVPRADGRGRVPAVEVLTNYERMFESIADEERSSRIQELIVEGSFHGCQSFDQALLKLYEDGVVEFHDAVANATDPTDLKLAAQAMGVRSA